MAGLLGQRFKAANQRFNGVLGRLIPANNLGGMLSPEEAEAARQQAQLATAASLLQASGPSLMPTSFGQALGGSLLAGQQAQSGAVDSTLARKLLQAKIGQLQAPPEVRTPTLIAELQALGLPPTLEGVRQLTEARGSRGTTINIGKEDEVIPINQLPNVRLPDGSTPPLGTTMRQAREMGATVQSSAEQQQGAKVDSAMAVVDQLEVLALGELGADGTRLPGGVFSNIEPGIASRGKAALEHIENFVTQDNPNITRYDDLSKSTLAPIIKSLGEAGALAEGDVQRALGLLPRVWPVPDTREVAEEKFASLRVILKRGLSNKAAGVVVDDLPPLPEGFTLDEEE